MLARAFFVVLLGGTDAVAAAQVISKQTSRRDVLNLTGRTTLAETAGVLQRTGLSISADTGMLHIAYGVGAPTVSLFGPGIPEKWVPPAPRHAVVRKVLPCSPCARFGRVPRGPYGVACMQSITVDDVTRTIEEILNP